MKVGSALLVCALFAAQCGRVEARPFDNAPSTYTPLPWNSDMLIDDRPSDDWNTFSDDDVVFPSDQTRSRLNANPADRLPSPVDWVQLAWENDMATHFDSLFDRTGRPQEVLQDAIDAVERSLQDQGPLATLSQNQHQALPLAPRIPVASDTDETDAAPAA
ncbi:hypothetical protein H4R35_004615 [Dimargaris xerosporica]|nr:hypothetical protein H4R35_004615 [Dimargaris xerosporica]